LFLLFFPNLIPQCLIVAGVVKTFSWGLMF
jgi:hypothetical protein